MKISALFLGIFAAVILQTGHTNGFVDDSSVTLTTRNYFFNRDYQKSGEKYPAARDWAQGFILKANSGYTPGIVGLGVDIQAFAGFNLLGDSSNNYAGSGLFPVNSKNEHADQYGEIRWTAKAKVSKSTLHVGTLAPMFPVLFSSPARLFQQNYEGAHLQFNEVNNLKVHALYVDKVNQRDSTNYERIRVANTNKRFKTNAESSGMHLLGAEYKVNDQINTQFFYSELHDVYQQNFIGVKTNHDIGIGHFLTDVRLFISEDAGSALAGNIENQHLGGLFGLQRGNHTFSLGYMQSFGDTAMPTLTGTEPAVFLDCISGDFSNKDERVYSVRYDYEFKNTPLNGLKFMTRYNKGVDIDQTQIADDNYKERALDFDLSYRIPSGKLEGLNIRARHTRYRNDLTLVGQAFRPDDETRLNIDYTWKFK